jgi:hypothetical protein
MAVHAAPTAQGAYVVAQFSAPVLSGSVYDTNNQPLSLDNTASAVRMIVNSTDVPQTAGSTLTWGSNPDSSSLTFVGNSIPADPTAQFNIGTLTYTNGTSDVSTIIFAATLSFFKTQTGRDLTLIGSSSITIQTTLNQAVPGSEAHDADSVYFSSANSTAGSISMLTFHVYESATASADLMGTITGDPVLRLTDIVIAPGQENNGFIFNGTGPLPLVPEPSSLTLLALGLGGIAMVWYRSPK